MPSRDQQMPSVIEAWAPVSCQSSAEKSETPTALSPQSSTTVHRVPGARSRSASRRELEGLEMSAMGLCSRRQPQRAARTAVAALRERCVWNDAAPVAPSGRAVAVGANLGKHN
jgi:hypothetical protein